MTDPFRLQILRSIFVGKFDPFPALAILIVPPDLEDFQPLGFPVKKAAASNMKLRSREYGNNGLAVISRPQNPLTEFHLFPKFPPEVRDIIWKLSLPERIVELQLYEGANEDPNFHHFHSNAKPVPALVVCHDSRNSVLPFYLFCFGKIRANLPLDTPYLDFGNTWDPVFTFFESLNTEECENIKLAISNAVDIDLDDAEEQDYFWDRVCTHLRALSNLRRCRVVICVRWAVKRKPGTPVASSDLAFDMEFFDQIPDELMRRGDLGILEQHRMVRGHYLVRDPKWEGRRAEYVYGWRREQPLVEPVKTVEEERAEREESEREEWEHLWVVEPGPLL